MVSVRWRRQLSLVPLLSGAPLQPHSGQWRRHWEGRGHGRRRRRAARRQRGVGVNVNPRGLWFLMQAVQLQGCFVALAMVVVDRGRASYNIRNRAVRARASSACCTSPPATIGVAVDEIGGVHGPDQSADVHRARIRHDAVQRSRMPAAVELGLDRARAGRSAITASRKAVILRAESMLVEWSLTSFVIDPVVSSTSMMSVLTSSATRHA